MRPTGSHPLPWRKRCTEFASSSPVFAFAITPARAQAPVEPNSGTVRASFVGIKGTQIGTAVLRQTPEGVAVEIDARDLPAGIYALRIHNKAACMPPHDIRAAEAERAQSEPKDFISTEGPAPAGSPKATAAQSIPGQVVREDGVLRVQMVLTGVTLKSTTEASEVSLLGPGGSALVLHAIQDSVNQAAAEPGPRAACAALRSF
jgi:Cu-Zn family superoxide dismutase